MVCETSGRPQDGYREKNIQCPSTKTMVHPTGRNKGSGAKKKRNKGGNDEADKKYGYTMDIMGGEELWDSKRKTKRN